MNLFIIYIAQYVLYVVIFFAVLVILSASRKEQIRLAKLVVISFPLSYVLAKGASHLISDPRPFVVDHITPLFHHVADNGFPSDHTLLAMTIAAVVFTYNKNYGVTLTFLAFCIGIARVLAHVHHMEDIVGSIAIGTAGVFVSQWIVSKTNKYVSLAEKR